MPFTQVAPGILVRPDTFPTLSTLELTVSNAESVRGWPSPESESERPATGSGQPRTAANS